MEQILDYTLLKAGKVHLKVEQLFLVLALLLMLRLLLWIVRKLIYKGRKIDNAKKYTIYSLIRYVSYVFTIVMALDLLGINVSIFLAGSAALLVGIGLGLQNLFSDFVSGIILLVDGAVKINDIIEINGVVCKVETINLRTTTVSTRDGRYIILPNTDLTKNQLINWSHSGALSRFEIKVGVGYGVDTDQACALMIEAAKSKDMVATTPEPFCRLEDFGDSSIVLGLYFWTDDRFMVENLKSTIRKEIWTLFRQHGVEIPFPQRVVHLNPTDPA